MQKRLLFLISLLLCLTTATMAQITTSGMSGTVTADGEEVIGATIEAIHLPSGTKYQAVTNTKGMYAINGMRPGGPYQVKVSYIGYQTKDFKDITLQLGQTLSLNVWLDEDAQQLGEVVIQAKATKFTTEKTGASTNIDNSMIQNMPSISRSITDYARLSPYGGNGMGFAGSDSRTSNFSVDGADFNNNFGLSGKLPGGGNPISIDAIQEMQVVVSPFDVRQTNFIGGGVNAITKSGTNTFKGTAYVYHQNQHLHGDAIDGEQLDGARDKDATTTYGLTFGGPIIKDKLFFFVSGEMIRNPKIVNHWRASEDGVGDPDNYLSRTRLSDLQTVSDFVRQRYGYNTGSFTDFPAETTNYKVLARIDWNITDQHHLSFRYNFTKNHYWNTPSGTSMDGGTPSSAARFSDMSFGFANTLYGMSNKVHSFSLDLNSRFSNNLSNQFLVTFSKLDDVRDTNSDEFPFIDILDGSGTNYMSLGYELFSLNNAVHNNVWNAKDDVTWYLGNHKLLGGINFEHQMADNQYMRNGTGYYRYRTLDDFINGEEPEIVALTYGYGGNTEPAARVSYSKVGLYLQDEWQAAKNFKLTYGMRIDDIFFSNKDLMTNNAILAIDYNGTHINTGKWPGSKVNFSPRVGFTWDILGNQSLKLRGGTGIFMGRVPLVYFTNMPSNSGMNQYQAVLNGTGAMGATKVDMSQFAGGLVTDANRHATIAALKDKLFSMGFPENITPDQGTVSNNTSAVDPDYHMPQVWKSSLAIDYSVPVSFPLTLTLEGTFRKNIYETIVRDISVPDVKGFARFNGADSRHIYPSGYRNGLPAAYVLENTHKGYGWTYSASVTAKPWEWLDLFASYTHTASKELTGLPGNNAASCLRYMATVDGPNFLQLHNSAYVQPDRFIFSANLHDKSGNHWNIVYETYRGSYNPSITTTNDMNGDGYNWDAIYIPTDRQVAENQFRFKTADDRDRFMAYVHSNSYLKHHQGQYAEAYSLYSPWVHRVDLGYKHDFKFKIGATDHKFQFSFDMKNVLNFLNSGWGVEKWLNPDLRDGSSDNNARILKYEGTDSEGYAVFSTPAAVNGNTKTWTLNHSIGQCWYVSLGLKYYFN